MGRFYLTLIKSNRDTSQFPLSCVQEDDVESLKTPLIFQEGTEGDIDKPADIIVIVRDTSHIFLDTYPL